jgi:hypothetical protein
VRENAHALTYASDRIKEDMVLAAVRQDTTALMHASDSLKDDENIVKAKNIGLKCMRPKDFKQRLGCNFFLM